jgi:hypothetical protein
MLFRRKRGDDVLDLVPLERVRKRLEEEKKQSSSVPTESISQESQTQVPNDLFASFSEATTNTSNETTPTSSYISIQEENSINSPSKMQEIEDRLDNLSRRTSSIIDRIDLIEKKIRRLEGK